MAFCLEILLLGSLRGIFKRRFANARDHPHGMAANIGALQTRDGSSAILFVVMASTRRSCDHFFRWQP